MPGVQACGRCGASLRLAALVIDVHPPRAGAWAKRWRRWLPFGGFNLPFGRFELRRGFNFSARGILGHGPGEGPAWAVLRRMVLPGWSQIYQGNAARGRWFLGSYLACLLLGLGTAGSFVGSVFLGLAVAAHASSTIDVAVSGLSSRQGRQFYSLMGCLMLALMIYVPAGWLATQVASPRQLLAAAAPFHRGDVVLVNFEVYGRREPHPGEVVLYDVRRATVASPTAWRTATQIAGERIDRILAGSGQKVTIDAGRVVVDGQPVPYLPLNPKRMPATLSVEVPSHCFLILPTTALADRYDLTGLDWQRLGLVPTSSVMGKVYLRHYPFWRFWWIR
ncbi:MAG TPA: S26 family signal peptidase [Pirellulales bacterium]|nr:S26 family signal peptidase [Pirellulales bacterium]